MKNLLNITMAVTVLATLTQTAGAIPPGAGPEVASTSVLLGVAFGGLAMARRFFRR